MYDENKKLLQFSAAIFYGETAVLCVEATWVNEPLNQASIIMLC